MQGPVLHLLPEDSWFREYLSCFPLAEPPESHILFAAMSMMGAVLGRRVWVDQMDRKLWPMLNLLLIGPSGIGKSTSILALAQEHLMKPLPQSEQPQFIGQTTPEKLWFDLSRNPHAVLWASELAVLFNKQRYNDALVPTVTELLDYKDMRRSTKVDGEQVIHDPSVTVIGGSTVEWLQEQLPDSATAGGFLARFLIVPEEHKRQRVPNPKSVLTARQRLDLDNRRAHMRDKFRACVNHWKGEMTFTDYEAEDAFSMFYTSYIPDTGTLAPFAARAGEFVLRLAMLSAVARGRGTLDIHDVRAGVGLYGYAHNKLQDVVVPLSPAGKLAKAVLGVLGHKELTEAEVCRAMRNMCSSQDTLRTLQSLQLSGEVQCEKGKYRRVRS